MTFSLIEDRGDVRISYDSILVHPKKMNIFNSDLSLKIINELVKEPGCAMDLARKLGQHEQKIYYHIRKMEDAGVIRMTSLEKRYGMNAKIYSVVSPVISTKIYDDGHEVEKSTNIINKEITKFFEPFIKNGVMNSITIIGDTYSHGRFDMGSAEGPYTFDLGMLLGNLVKDLSFPHYKFDTEITQEDLKKNLILIGNSQTNVIIDRINKNLPFYFDEKNEFYIVSRKTGNVHKDARIGVIIKMDNPFANGKKILILGGRGRRGTNSAILACTKHFHKLTRSVSKENNMAKIIKGFDMDGDKVIDDIEVLE